LDSSARIPTPCSSPWTKEELKHEKNDDQDL